MLFFIFVCIGCRGVFVGWRNVVRCVEGGGLLFDHLFFFDFIVKNLTGIGAGGGGVEWLVRRRKSC